MKPASREVRFAILIELATRLRNAGSWCGETHLQKSVFALETLATSPLSYEFIMYKHGPFSFDLRDEILGLRAARLVEFELKEGYGPRLRPSDLSDIILDRNRTEVNKISKALNLTVEWLGKKDVKELEKLATALFVIIRKTDKSFAERVSYIKELKPHISASDAERALQAAEQKIIESKRAKLI